VILRKIIKSVATRCQFLKLKCSPGEPSSKGREEERGKGRNTPVPDWETEKVATLIVVS